MYVTVSLVAGLKELLKWTVMEVSVDYTFLKLLEIAVEKSGHSSASDSESATCSLSQDIKCTTKVQVALDYNVCQCCDMNGKFVRFSLPGEETSLSGAGRNAFTILMASALALHLPKKLDSSNARGDNLLYNDIIDFMSEHSLGFSAGVEHTSGKQVVSTPQGVYTATLIVGSKSVIS